MAFEQRDHGFAAVMAVAAHQDLHFGPVHANAGDDVTQNVRDLLARRPLAGTDQRQHGLARGGLEDFDRLEAGGADMRIEERELLLAVRGIIGVVDIEHDAVRHTIPAFAEQVDEPQSDAFERAPVGQVLEPGQRRLAHQIEAALGGAAARDLERRIGAQRIEVVAVLIAGRDRHHARRRHVGVGVDDARRIAVVGQRRGDDVGEAQPQRDLAQDDDAAVRGHQASIEGGCERLARDR